MQCFAQMSSWNIPEDLWGCSQLPARSKHGIVPIQGGSCNLWPSDIPGLDLRCLKYLCVTVGEGACVAELAGALRRQGKGDHHLSLSECLTSILLAQVSLLDYLTCSGHPTAWAPRVLLYTCSITWAVFPRRFIAPGEEGVQHQQCSVPRTIHPLY